MMGGIAKMVFVGFQDKAPQVITNLGIEVFQDKAAKMSQESTTYLFVLRLRADQMAWKKWYFNGKVHQMREKAILSGDNAECYFSFVQRKEWTRQFEKCIQGKQKHMNVTQLGIMMGVIWAQSIDVNVTQI